MKKVYEEFFTFSNLIGKLKELERFKGQIFWRDYPTPRKYDSVADHSWRIAMLVLLFEDKLSKKFNTEKALKMAILHDVAEVIAGDADPLGDDGTGNNAHTFNPKLKTKKDLREQKAAKKIFSLLPKKNGNEFLKLWKEYEKRECFEAKVVKALDRIEGLLQVMEWRGGNLFAKHYEFTIRFLHTDVDVDPALSEFRDFLLEKLKKNYKEFKK